MSIKPLSKETVKLINSTQVIVSIYSAVKELVENSLDAQAQNIEVNLVDNGMSLIEVKDNGVGINKDDAQYMGLPSYTSKIQDFNDLDLLSTYGFRGEGLTAVCQVSDVTVCTKTAEDETMTKYVLNNEGHVVATEISHGLNGTTVQMRNLFKNMPVRRNILNNKRRINQEIKAIELLLKTYAICKPSVRFTFRVNSNKIFIKPACKNVTEAIKSVIGIQTFSKLACIEKEFLDSEMQLFIPKKEIKDRTEISQAGLQFLCVNDRPIRSKEIEKKINKRISEFFNEKTSSQKFIFCLILKVPPTTLDVNLEPNKDKVFLQNEAIVLSELDSSLLNFYDLPDSQLSTQNNNENIDHNVNESQKEKEVPACKKRKLDIQKDNIVVVNENFVNIERNLDEIPKKSNDDFFKSLSQPMLSDSDSNDELRKENQTKDNNEVSEKMEVDESKPEDSENFDFKIKDNPIIEETISQLPLVDLGDDFDWKEIVNKCNANLAKTTITPEKVFDKQGISDVAWSKGQVPGLQGGISVGIHNSNDDIKYENQLQESETFDIFNGVEKINDSESIPNNSEPDIQNFQWDKTLKNPKASTKNNNKLPTSTTSKQRKSNFHEDPTQTKIPFAGDNACLSAIGPSAFAMYCTSKRAEIIKNNPELTPAEVAARLNQEWKKTSPEEREYYRDLANQQKQNMSVNSSMVQTPKKPKPQLSEAEKEKNRKKLVNMLSNMKSSKAEVKNESMIMRTYKPWSINISSVTDQFKKLLTKEISANFMKKPLVIGSLNSLLWLVNLKSSLFVFDITELHAQLSITGYDISQINTEYVESVVNRWLLERNDMSVFHQIHSLKHK